MIFGKKPILAKLAEIGKIGKISKIGNIRKIGNFGIISKIGKIGSFNSIMVEHNRISAGFSSSVSIKCSVRLETSLENGQQ
jgi:hypothetical protein